MIDDREIDRRNTISASVLVNEHGSSRRSDNSTFVPVVSSYFPDTATAEDFDMFFVTPRESYGMLYVFKVLRSNYNLAGIRNGALLASDDIQNCLGIHRDISEYMILEVTVNVISAQHSSSPILGGRLDKILMFAHKTCTHEKVHQGIVGRIATDSVSNHSTWLNSNFLTHLGIATTYRGAL